MTERVAGRNCGQVFGRLSLGHKDLTLKAALYADSIDPRKLDPRNNSHLALIRNRSLDDLLRSSPASERSAIVLRYEERMAPLIQEYYELVLEGGHERKTRFKDFWDGENGKEHLRVLTRYLFEQKIGLVIDKETRTIDPRLFRAGQKRFLKDQGVPDWPQLFARYKLTGGLGEPLDSEHSIIEVFQRVYPWIFDYDTPEGQHLHFTDFKFPITDEARIKKMKVNEFRHILEKHAGLRMDETGRVIDTRLLDTKQYLASQGISRWADFMVRFGSINLIYGQYQSSFYLIMRDAYPWAFDLTTAEGSHLHPWDFSYKRIWAGRAGRKMARAAVRHVFQKHLGLVDEAERSFDERLQPKNHGRLFSARKVKEGWRELLAQEDLAGMYATVYKKSFLEMMEDAFPWLFDLDAEEGRHLHAWEFVSMNKWQGKEGKRLIRSGLHHVAQRHLGLSLEREALLEGLTRKALVDNGFTDHMRREYGYNRKSIFRIAFPVIFPGKMHFQDWLDNLKTDIIYWNRVPQHIRRWLVDILAAELDKEVDLLKTSDFHRRLAVFGDKSLEGLLHFYMKPGMTESEALKELKRDLGILLQERNFIKWLLIFRKRPVIWREVPDQVKIIFVLFLSRKTGTHLLDFEKKDYERELEVFNGKSLVTLFKSYLNKEGQTESALVKLIRLVIDSKREEVVPIRENELLRQKLLEKGSHKMLSLSKAARRRYIAAYLDPAYFSPEERKEIALSLLLSCSRNQSPMATKRNSEYRRDIADCLIMLGLISGAIIKVGE